MSMVLQRDKNYEYVTCPICNHSWYERVQDWMYDALHGSTIFCRSCRAPLKAPKASLGELSKPKSKKL